MSLQAAAVRDARAESRAELAELQRAMARRAEAAEAAAAAD